MNHSEFNKIVESTITNTQKLLVSKGAEYAGNEDRLSNFKRGAELTGSNPLQIALIYLSKHYDSLGTYVRNESLNPELNKNLSEPIEGRLDDIINYCILIKAIIQERSDQLHKPFNPTARF